MKAQLSPRLLKKVKTVDVRIRRRFYLRIAIFEKNHLGPILNNHALKSEYSGYRSINITADYRAVYEEVDAGDDKKIAYFIALGTHEELFSPKT
jgi:addiction module RelE/StbE family toxin